MKKVICILTAVVMLLSAVIASAGSWSIHCTNNSCEASQGKLKVYWMASSFSDTYSGKLTGVEGIPVTIEDFSSAEKKVEQAIEKSITRKKSGSTDAKADVPEVGGPSAGVSGSKENLFTKKRTMSQSKTMGKKINIDYTLAFVEWLGDTRYGYNESDRSIKKYWSAAEAALDAYKDGSLPELIERFFIARNAADVDEIDVTIKLNDSNRDLVMTKYLGLLRFMDAPDIKTRYARANYLVYLLGSGNSSYNELAVKISRDFPEDIRKLQILIQPGQTALKLYKKDKALAVSKWMADNAVADNGKSSIMSITNNKSLPLVDRYLIAAHFATSFQEFNKGVIADSFAEFESAMKNNDESIRVVTVKGSPFPIIPAAVVIGSGALIGTVIFIKRKKKSKQ
jgi:hypothetical protein